MIVKNLVDIRIIVNLSDQLIRTLFLSSFFDLLMGNNHPNHKYYSYAITLNLYFYLYLFIYSFILYYIKSLSQF